MFLLNQGKENIIIELNIPTRLAPDDYTHPPSPRSENFIKKRKIVQDRGPNQNPQKTKNYIARDLRETS